MTKERGSLFDSVQAAAKRQYTITLFGGRDPLPVLSTWSTKAKAQAQVPHYRAKGYVPVVHRVGESPMAPKKSSKKTAKRGSKKKTQIPLSVLKKRHAALGRIIARREK